MRRGSARWRDEKHSLQRGRARRRRGKLPPNHGLLTHRNHARKRARRHQLSIGHSCRTASPQLSHASCPNFKLEPSFCSAWAAERLWMLCRNSTRNLCGINNIAQTALVEFLPIMGSRKAVDARNDRNDAFTVDCQLWTVDYFSVCSSR